MSAKRAPLTATLSTLPSRRRSAVSRNPRKSSSSATAWYDAGTLLGDGCAAQGYQAADMAVAVSEPFPCLCDAATSVF